MRELDFMTWNFSAMLYRSGTCNSQHVPADPSHEKTNKLGFQPGQTQTGRTVTEAGEKIEISDLRRRGTILTV